jgi:SAM-dependent methyltransferase
MCSHPRIYDSIGIGYSDLRVPDPRIQERIQEALGGRTRVCNVGAGTGSYEPVRAVAVEPSRRMLDQGPRSRRAVRAVAETLPFRDLSFEAVLAVLTVHHWVGPEAGLAELCRIAPHRVVLAFDVSRVDSLWLVRDYLPEIVELDSSRMLSLDSLTSHLRATRVVPLPIPWDCTDGFQAAYWRRPERYLDARVRACISTFAQLPEEIVTRAMARLRDDLESGAWHSRNADLLEHDALDFGYRIVISSE